jgi:hypothetical protein
VTAPTLAGSGVAGDIGALRELAEELAQRAAEPVGDVSKEEAAALLAKLVAECDALRDALTPLLAVVEAAYRPKPGEGRHRAVKALSAASMALARAGRQVSVQRGCRLAAGELATAVEMLGALR